MQADDATLAALRQQLVALSHRAYAFNLVPGVSGNLSGEVDVVVAGGIAPAYYGVSLREPLRVLSLTDEEVGLVRERMPQVPILEADFSQSYRGAGKARLLAPWAVMAARHDLDPGLVHQITKAVFDNLGTIVKIY